MGNSIPHCSSMSFVLNIKRKRCIWVISKVVDSAKYCKQIEFTRDIKAKRLCYTNNTSESQWDRIHTIRADKDSLPLKVSVYESVGGISKRPWMRCVHASLWTRKERENTISSRVMLLVNYLCFKNIYILNTPCDQIQHHKKNNFTYSRKNKNTI